MTIPIKNDNGLVVITERAIKTVVGKSVRDNYGVKEMPSQAKIHDNIQEFLKHRDYSKGVTVSYNNHKLVINVHLIAPDDNIIAIAKSIQSTVKFNLKAILGITDAKINIIVEDVFVNNDK